MKISIRAIPCIALCGLLPAAGSMAAASEGQTVTYTARSVPVQGDGPRQVTAADRPVTLSRSPATEEMPESAGPEAWEELASVVGVVTDLSFPSATVGFAAAELGLVWKTSDGGENWVEVMNVGFPYYWYGVHALSEDDVIVTGFNNTDFSGIARWTHDGGETWSEDVILTDEAWSYRVRFADASTGLVLDGLAVPQEGTFAHFTTSGGESEADWNAVVAEPEGGWFGQQFSLLPNGSARAAGIKYCESVDAGANWSCRPSIDSVFDGGVFFLDDDLHGWVGGGSISPEVAGWVHRTTDGGVTWTEERDLQAAWPIRGLFFLTSDVGAEGALAFAPPSLDFGEIVVGSTSDPQSAELQNVGDGAVTGITFDVPEGAFTVDTDDCGPDLGPGEACSVSVTFTPAEPGAAEAQAGVTADQDVFAELALSGEGVSGGGGFTPIALTIDSTQVESDGNGVFEPAESVDVAPAWHNDGVLAESLAGTASNFTGPEGATYSIDLDTADYGLIEPGATASCLDTEICYRLGLDDPAARPAAHWDGAFDETLDDTDGTTRTWTLHIGASFSDVPTANPFYPAIETLLHSGVTGGCTAGAEAVGLGPGRGPDLTAGTNGRDRARPLQGGAAYCPGGANSRAQMPVFVLRALEGADYTPLPCVEGADPFGDVPFDSTFCPWIQDLAGRGIISGCGNGDYCPGNPVTRAQMAIFLLKTLEGADYEPPGCTERFTDVPCPSLFADWIEDLAERGITGGCSETEYCPSDAVTRAQMAVFVVKTFGLTLYGP